MKTLLVFSRLIDAVTENIGKAVGWLILVAVLVSAGNAIVRKVFNTSSNAWLEAQWYLFGGAFMLAAAYTLAQNEHIRIDVVYGTLKRRTQHWIDLLGHILFLMPFVLLMVYFLVPYVTMSFRSGEISSSAGGLIVWPARLMIPVGFLLLILQAISELIKRVGFLQGLCPDPSQKHSTLTAEEDLTLVIKKRQK